MIDVSIYHLNFSKHKMIFQYFLFLFCLASGDHLNAEDYDYKILELDGKIVGGQVVSKEEYPYIVIVRRNGRYCCGGAILSEKFIATAAHCVYNKTGIFSVYASTISRYTQGDVYIVRSVYSHEKFNLDTYDYDIAILKLWGQIKFTASAYPIDLPTQNYKLTVGSKAICSGWGRTAENGVGSQVLRAVTIKILDSSICKKSYKNYLISDRMICAGIPEEGKDACYGDSGGPLVVDGYLVGLVSWGIGCARPDFPGVYTDIHSFLDYIRQIMKEKN